MRKTFSIPILLKESAGHSREKDPVRIGVPFCRGDIYDCNEVELYNHEGDVVSLQGHALAHWPDRSIKWMLIDFFGKVSAHSETSYFIKPSAETNSVKSGLQSGELRIKEDEIKFTVDTSVAIYCVPKKIFAPFSLVEIDGTNVLSDKGCRTYLIDSKEEVFVPRISTFSVEESGPLRCTLCATGQFAGKSGKAFASFSGRLTFWHGLSICSCEFEIHNPNAALHPGGLWDLGDRGSLFFQELSLVLYLSQLPKSAEWTTEPFSKVRRSSKSDILLYQDSSGGENWNSPNHIDYEGKSTVTLRGFRITTFGQNSDDAQEEASKRTTPYLRANLESSWVAGTVRDFWQNFPKALGVDGDKLRIGIFPSECSKPFELQGGEKKRHFLLLDFGKSGDETIIPHFQSPLSASVAPEWIEKTGAVPFFIPEHSDVNSEYLNYVQNVIAGPNSFFKRREIIDEYGWRNFGDLYADHEAVGQSDPSVFISHYNNQYDFIYGAAIHFMRSGDHRWYDLMVQCARHVIDIDIYHTDQDKAGYNHGLFWHTDHYKNAFTSTHRGYSRKNLTPHFHNSYGGGPSNEHNYTSGLLYYYYLTGDVEARDAVLELADWVISMDDGRRTLFGLFDEGPTGLASQTAQSDYHGPGRGAGNSVNALMDAYVLTNNRRYLEKAEELIRRCIHPDDDINGLNLDDPEHRWSYLVFLQTLGKYLDLKVELGETDYYYYYARDSLLHYADWMLDNEVPYKEVLHKVDIPTETWPAHDIRKCHIFHLARKYGQPGKRKEYHDRACFFFKRCMEDLLSFKTAYLTRPLVILTVVGFVHGYFLKYNDEHVEYKDHNYSFGEPREFVPQRLRFKSAFKRKFDECSKLAKRIIMAQLHRHPRN